MDPLGNSVNSDPDGIKSSARWESGDQVNSYHRPTIFGNLIGHEMTCWRCREDLGPVACITSLDITCHIPRDSRPPEVASDEFQSTKFINSVISSQVLTHAVRRALKEEGMRAVVKDKKPDL